MLRLVIVCLLTLAVSLMVTPLVRSLAPRLGAIDKPEARKVHAGLMPRLGGSAIYIAFVCGVLATGFYTRQVAGLLLSSTIVFAIGVVDDIKGVSSRTKLLFQLIGAIVFVVFGGYVKYITNPIGGNLIFLDYWGVPVTLLWLVGISNAVNLIDGLDGLAGGVSIISAFTMAVVSYSRGYTQPAVLAILVAVATLGFLKYNFHPASIFMGDSGSLFLGFALGAIAIMGFSKGATVIALIMPILILGIPIFDTFFAIIRRYSEHKPIFQADRGHLHHRLLDLGLSHKQTVGIIYAITLFMGVCAIALTMLSSAQAIVILIFAGLAVIFGARRLGVLRRRRPRGQEQHSKEREDIPQ